MKHKARVYEMASQKGLIFLNNRKISVKEKLKKTSIYLVLFYFASLTLYSVHSCYSV